MTKYRVWCVNNAGKQEFMVNSPAKAKKLIDKLALEQLKDESIMFNAFGLEVYEDGEWSEWYDENGDGIDEAVEAE